MMRTAALVSLALLALLAGPAAAGVFRVDEAGTVVSQPVVAMKWRALVPGRAADNTIEAALRVDVRLNLQPWLNRPARIYLVLNPLPSGERIHARWNTQGRLRTSSRRRSCLYPMATRTRGAALRAFATNHALARPTPIAGAKNTAITAAKTVDSTAATAE